MGEAGRRRRVGVRDARRRGDEGAVLRRRVHGRGERLESVTLLVAEVLLPKTTFVFSAFTRCYIVSLNLKY